MEPAVAGTSLAGLDAWLVAEEAGVPGLAAGEAKGIVWADPATPARTPFALVYLHGFSADRHEIDPLVGDLARDLGANAYFARLTGHAQGGEALARATADDWLADVAEAVAVGSRIGERVALIGTSTGGTLALWAAVQPEAAGRLHALVLISPNLGLRDRRSEMLLWAWGGVVARLVEGTERCFEPVSAAQARHWTTCYPTRALLPMMALVDEVRSIDPREVRLPTLVIRSEHDEVVDPTAIARFAAGLAAEGSRTIVVNDAGDPAHHILAGEIMSPRTTARARDEIRAFLVASLD